ncbi:MAG: peptidylprolyl isomerase [Candidatus Latescibacteria bacterium]|nr:peptidylprolyl isomerase [Candidatus Latescibacterota bacterium]
MSYHPRRFASSPLDRLFQDHWETFLSVYEEQYQHQHGALRSVVERVVLRFLDCGNPINGFTMNHKGTPLEEGNMKDSAKVLALVVVVALTGCGRGQDSSSVSEAAEQWVEPNRLEVQHILISFEGLIPKEGLTRTKEQAEALANELLERVLEGEDFDSMVREYTDDEYPGIYRMANLNVQPDTANQEYARARMVKAFGDVSFSLKVGEISMTKFDPETSKYGWHIIKRLK